MSRRPGYKYRGAHNPYWAYFTKNTPKETPVICTTLDKEFRSMAQAELELKLPDSAITQAIRKRDGHYNCKDGRKFHFMLKHELKAF